MPDRRTLYDDWKARREQLAQLPYPAGDHRAVEAHVLDYLLQRYQDTPEGARPARFPLTANLYVNHRAIVVLHHLGGGRAPAVTTASEAQARVQSVVRRMSSLWSGNETAGQAECEDLITSPCLEDPAELWRMKLCDNDPIARIVAAVRLASVGTLDDIGLLSDLLALAPSDEEHPSERAAMVHSMQRLAGVVSEPFDLSGIVPSPSPQAAGEPTVAAPPEIKRPDRICSKCGAEVPGKFEICWSCGTDVDGLEDPDFHPVDALPEIERPDWICSKCGAQVPGKFESAGVVARTSKA